MIAAGDHRSTASPTQANSLTAPCAKVFVSCEESVPAATLEDIVNTTDFIIAADSCGGNCTLTAGQDAHSIRVGSPPTDDAVDGDPANWIDPAGKDWLYVQIAAPTDEDDASSPSRAVYIETYSASGSGAGLFIYAMRCLFISQDIVIPRNIAYCADLNGNLYTTPGTNVNDIDYCQGFNMENGEIHSVAGARRGDWLEHYVNGRLVGKVNVIEYAAEVNSVSMVSDWENWDGGLGIELTHAPHTGNGCASQRTQGHARADWYGVQQYVFADGLPSQASIEAGMNRMKEEWSEGNKIINPEWMTI